KTDQFPEHEQHHEIVRHNDSEHCEHEERQRPEIAGLAFVVPHIAERIDVDDCSNARDENEHHLAQLILCKTERDLESTCDVDPAKLWRWNVRSREDQTTANKA